MKKLFKFNVKDLFKKNVSGLKSSTVRIGGYSIFAVLFVIAIAIAANYFAAVLPSSAMEVDITSNQLFTLSDQTEKVVGNLEKDVTVYWVVRNDYEDAYLERMLDLYEGLSDNLTVVKKDPDISPTLISQYTDDVEDNSLIVVCGEQSTFVSYYDIYVYDYSSYYYDYTYDVTFECENALTSAIAYVTSDDLPKVYALEGHGESELSDTFADAVEGENIVLETLSLLTLEAVPEDADCVLIYA
nr:Gldg family protein [Candidatus Limiplasma sp.]